MKYFKHTSVIEQATQRVEQALHNEGMQIVVIPGGLAVVVDGNTYRLATCDDSEGVQVLPRGTEYEVIVAVDEEAPE